MNFQRSEDQQALQQGVRSFCQGRLSLDRLRALEGTGGFDPGLWKDLAELGVFGLRVPESDGGVGLGSADAVLVFEELGRALVPGPVLFTHLAAELVEGARSGDCVVGGLDLRGAAPEPFVLEHLEVLDVLLLLRPDGVWRVDPRKVRARAVGRPLDPFTPIHHAAELPEGERVAGPEAAAELRRAGAAFAAAQLLGIAEATQDLALDYAKQREQFGRPIGSFQAIKHMLADMFVRQEVARASVYAAGVTLDDPAVGDPERAVCGARIVAGDAAMKNSRACIQIHGGMGYTWEVPAHYYLKRTWVLETSFGDSAEHAERVASRIATG